MIRLRRVPTIGRSLEEKIAVCDITTAVDSETAPYPVSLDFSSYAKEKVSSTPSGLRTLLFTF